MTAASAYLHVPAVLQRNLQRHLQACHSTNYHGSLINTVNKICKHLRKHCSLTSCTPANVLVYVHARGATTQC